MLSQLGAEVEEQEYFKRRPTPAEIRSLAAQLSGGVADLVSTKSRRYNELGLAGRQLSDDEWVQLLSAEPGIWRRPVLSDGTRAVVGYSEAAIRELAE